MRVPRVFSSVLVVLAGTLVALAAAEAFLRLACSPPVVTSGWVCSSSVPRQERNQLGFRGHPIGYSDSTTVLVLVGDSQVEATHLAWDWMPESRLEHHLEEILGRDVEVASVAAQGYGQDQELLALEYYFEDFRADMVVVWETPANDLWNNTFPTHWPADGWAKPTFWLESGELAGPCENPGDALPVPPLRIVALLESALGRPSRDGAWEARLPAPYGPDSTWQGPARQEWQERWNTDLGLMRFENLATEKSHLAVYLTPRSPRMQYSVDLTRLLLDRIDSLSRSSGASAVFFAAEGPPDPTGDVEEATYVLNGLYYHVARSQYERNVHDSNSDVSFLELPIRIEDWKMGPLNSHLNEHATDLMMEDLALRLAPMLADSSPPDTE
ncbi:MAG: hypothetical protein QUS11_01630 [Candidatus Fermentibacter sp.]|nr:hypothetical protein [Candidatus Fermentibacter sp.]